MYNNLYIMTSLLEKFYSSYNTNSLVSAKLHHYFEIYMRSYLINLKIRKLVCLK